MSGVPTSGLRVAGVVSSSAGKPDPYRLLKCVVYATLLRNRVERMIERDTVMAPTVLIADECLRDPDFSQEFTMALMQISNAVSHAELGFREQARQYLREADKHIYNMLAMLKRKGVDKELVDMERSAYEYVERVVEEVARNLTGEDRIMVSTQPGIISSEDGAAIIRHQKPLEAEIVLTDVGGLDVDTIVHELFHLRVAERLGERGVPMHMVKRSSEARRIEEEYAYRVEPGSAELERMEREIPDLLDCLVGVRNVMSAVKAVVDGEITKGMADRVAEQAGASCMRALMNADRIADYLKRRIDTYAERAVERIEEALRRGASAGGR